MKKFHCEDFSEIASFVCSEIRNWMWYWHMLVGIVLETLTRSSLLWYVLIIYRLYIMYQIIRKDSRDDYSFFLILLLIFSVVAVGNGTYVVIEGDADMGNREEEEADISHTIPVRLFVVCLSKDQTLYHLVALYESAILTNRLLPGRGRYASSNRGTVR